MRHGFLLIDKPKGPTSHDVVYQVRKRLHDRDVGHIGTLDPGASGLLVLAVGKKALKVIEFFSGLGKCYTANIQFGYTSTTYDADGVLEQVVCKPGWTEPEEIQIRRLIDERFTGSVSQRPPAYSAVHINGKRAYDLARKGEKVDMPERTVRIEACRILRYAYPHLVLDVSCGSGTYIRSLAHDLGAALRCGGYLSDLRRTSVGEWLVDHAVAPDACTWTDIIPLKEILKSCARVDVSDVEMTAIGHGQRIEQRIEEETFAWHNGLPAAVLIPHEGGARPRKVL